MWFLSALAPAIPRGEPERGKGPSSKPRLGYKMAFLTELRERCDAWVAQGRDVLLVG